MIFSFYYDYNLNGWTYDSKLTFYDKIQIQLQQLAKSCKIFLEQTFGWMTDDYDITHLL